MLPYLQWATGYPITNDPSLICVALNRGLMVNLKCQPDPPVQLAYICETRQESLERKKLYMLKMNPL